MASGHIILAGTGGIAASKAVELASMLTQRGDTVVTLMTESARRFVTPLTFQAVTQRPVLTSVFEEVDRPEHITVSDDGRAMVIAPATANILGKIAAGIADDLVTTTAISFPGPKIVAPAMNVRMWENPIVQENVRRLEGLGFHLVPPAEGHLACGHYGMGRLAAVEDIIEVLDRVLTD